MRTSSQRLSGLHPAWGGSPGGPDHTACDGLPDPSRHYAGRGAALKCFAQEGGQAGSGPGWGAGAGAPSSGKRFRFPGKRSPLCLHHMGVGTKERPCHSGPSLPSAPQLRLVQRQPLQLLGWRGCRGRDTEVVTAQTLSRSPGRTPGHTFNI